MWQMGNEPAPLVAVGWGSDAVPVETRTSPALVTVKTEPVMAFGAPDITVGVPLTVVRTGVTVFGTPLASTVTHGSVGAAAACRIAWYTPGAAITASQSSNAAASRGFDACILGLG